MKKRYLDLRGAGGAEDMHARIAEALDFPAYYGSNLDALHDCLTDIDEDICVGIYGPVAPEAEDLFSRALMVFRDAEEENPHLCVFSFTETAGEDPRRHAAESDFVRELLEEEEAEMMGQYFDQGEDYA